MRGLGRSAPRRSEREDRFDDSVTFVTYRDRDGRLPRLPIRLGLFPVIAVMLVDIVAVLDCVNQRSPLHLNKYKHQKFSLPVSEEPNNVANDRFRIVLKAIR
jgi:hypothetical protein